MKSPLNVFNSGKPASRAYRWRLAAALGAVTAIGASAVAVASPAKADEVYQDCVAYHSWTVCVSYDLTNGNTAVTGMNSGNAGTHSLFLEVNGGYYSNAYTFNAGQWYGFAEHVDPGTDKTWGGIDSTRIVGAYIP